MKTVGTIFAVKPFSLHDGPNLRTTVFFKGCPLNCLWCHNPEGIQPATTVVSSPDKCVGCGECVAQCQQGALVLKENTIVRESEKCSCCFGCVEQCPALVHEAIGWQSDVAGIMEVVKKDIAFFDQSGGGVTFSGGEPLAQPEFLLALLKACGQLAIHRVVDTSVWAPSKVVREVAAYTDLFLCDIKHMDDSIHKKNTGVGNELILDNIRLLASKGQEIRIRVPLIPGMNDSPDNLLATAAFIKTLGISSIDMLPYHQAARAKYDKLNIVYPGETIKKTEDKDLHQAVTLMERCGLEVVIGG